MTWKAQNEMRAWNGMPARVRLSEGLGLSGDTDARKLLAELRNL
jgi:hypothetical protein